MSRAEQSPPMTPAALRTIADWLDTYDSLAEAFYDALERGGSRTPDELAKVRAATAGKEVQSDLRRWADEMEAKA